jgi:hypothetical protein
MKTTTRGGWLDAHPIPASRQRAVNKMIRICSFLVFIFIY